MPGFAVSRSMTECDRNSIIKKQLSYPPNAFFIIMCTLTLSLTIKTLFGALLNVAFRQASVLGLKS